MDQFRNFSTIQNYSPGSSQYDGQLAAPVMPKYAEFSNEEPEDEKKSGGGKSGGGSLLDKIDPLGSKLFGGLL